MTAQIVIDDGGGPVVGTIERASTLIGTVCTLSNYDDTGIAGWLWTLVDKPYGSAAALSATDTATVEITGDIEGGYLLRLQTYTDAARTLLEDVDEQLIGIALPAPFDWQVPAAGETGQRGARGWATPRELAIKDVHAFMNSGFLAVQGAQNEDTSVVGSEVVMGGFVFTGGNLGPLGAKLRLIGMLTTATPATDLHLRLYDMGAPGVPAAGILRATATIPYASAGTVQLAETTLSAVAVPGVDADQVHLTQRIYELRLIIDGGTAGDAAKLHFGGIALV